MSNAFMEGVDNYLHCKVVSLLFKYLGQLVGPILGGRVPGSLI